MSNALGLKTWGEKIASEQKESLTELTEDALVDDGYTALDGEIPFSKEQLEQTENAATAEDLPYTEAQLSHAENKVPHTASSHLTDHSQVKTSPRDVIAEATHVNQKVDTDTVNTVITFTPLPVEAADSEQVPEANWAPWDDEDEDGEATAMPVTAPSTENGEDGEDGGDSEAPRTA